MTIPMVSSKAEARDFVRHLTGTPELWRVVSAFQDTPAGLAERIADLARIRTRLTGDEADHADRVLAGWRQAPPAPPLDRDGDLEQLVAWMRGLAEHRWDFRHGRERDYIPTSGELLSPDLADGVYALADVWGMRAPTQPEGRFDHILVLGGLIRANVNRPCTAAELLAAGQVSAPSVIGLAGERAFSPIESALADGLGCPERSEQGSLRWGLARAFGTSDSTWTTTDSPALDELTDVPSGVRVRCGAAPAHDGTRVHTGSAFSWLVSRGASLVQPGSRLLSVTTAIYWIDGHIRLLTQMPEDSHLVTTGTPASNTDPLLQQTYRSQHYLQEVKAALDALPRLMDWAAR